MLCDRSAMVALLEEIEIEIRAPNGKLEWKLVVPAAHQSSGMSSRLELATSHPRDSAKKAIHRTTHTPHGTRGETPIQTMSAFTIASAAVALPARACASTRRAAAPAARVNLSGARLASAPARAAARRDRGAALVVRMATPGSNPNLDRENPELEEKFAVIG